MIKYFPALLFAGLVLGEVSGGGPVGSSLRDSSPLASLRITGGEKVKPKEIPYQLFLLAKNEITGVMHMCGASIYKSVWALTAAHCVVKQERNPGLVRLYAGYLNKSSPHSTGAEQEFQVSEIVVHHNYVHERYDGYDIALLRISEEFKFSEFVKAVELSEEEDLTNEMAVVSGWGATDLSGDPESKSEILHKAEVQILPWEDCREAWQSFNEGVEICTESAPIKKGPCNGDSGGPLVVRREQVHKLVGIASYVESGECNLRRPAVYTKVSAFIPWIKSIVE